MMKKSIFYSVSLICALGVLSSVNFLPMEGYAQVVKEKSKGERAKEALGFFGYHDKQIVASLTTLRQRAIESGHPFLVTDRYWEIASKPAEDYVKFYEDGLAFFKDPFFQSKLTLRVKGSPRSLLLVDTWLREKPFLSVQFAGLDSRMISGYFTDGILAELRDYLMRARAEDDNIGLYDCALQGEIFLTGDAFEAMHARGLSVRDVIDHVGSGNLRAKLVYKAV